MLIVITVVTIIIVIILVIVFHMTIIIIIVVLLLLIIIIINNECGTPEKEEVLLRGVGALQHVILTQMDLCSGSLMFWQSTPRSGS